MMLKSIHGEEAVEGAKAAYDIAQANPETITQGAKV